MKAIINNVEVHGTPTEIAELIRSLDVNKPVLSDIPVKRFKYFDLPTYPLTPSPVKPIDTFHYDYPPYTTCNTGGGSV